MKKKTILNYKEKWICNVVVTAVVIQGVEVVTGNGCFWVSRMSCFVKVSLLHIIPFENILFVHLTLMMYTCVSPCVLYLINGSESTIDVIKWGCISSESREKASVN